MLRCCCLALAIDCRSGNPPKCVHLNQAAWLDIVCACVRVCVCAREGQAHFQNRSQICFFSFISPPPHIASTQVCNWANPPCLDLAKIWESKTLVLALMVK